MKLTDRVKHAAVLSNLFRFVQNDTDEEKPVSDISIAYHDMGQTGRRTEKLQSESRKAEQSIRELMNVLAEKRGMQDRGTGNSVQLEREIDSVTQKIQELEKQRENLDTAAACCRMYGILGLDYSVSEGKLYYKGKSVRVFSDPDRSRADGEDPAAVYENPKGEISVMAKRGRTGSVLYLKIYDD